MTRLEAFLEMSRIAVMGAVNAHDQKMRAEVAAFVATGQGKPKFGVDAAEVCATYDDLMAAQIQQAKETEALD